MSHTVHYKGTLTKIERPAGESIEEQCKRIMEGKPLPKYMDNYEEFLLDNYYQSMTIQNGVLYEVAKIEMDGDSDVFNASKRSDGKIDFEVRYYNGGCGFDEAIEEALGNLQAEEVEDRKETLLKAALALLEKQDRSGYVLNLLSETVHYDDADCDGYCLMEDIKAELNLD